jgi:ornithine carbamoyltransferase
MSELLRGKDYIETVDFSNKEIKLLLDTSTELKEKFKNGISHKLQFFYSFLINQRAPGIPLKRELLN